MGTGPSLVPKSNVIPGNPRLSRTALCATRSRVASLTEGYVRPMNGHRAASGAQIERNPRQSTAIGASPEGDPAMPVRSPQQKRRPPPRTIASPHRTQEVADSSPASSTRTTPAGAGVRPAGLRCGLVLARGLARGGGTFAGSQAMNLSFGRIRTTGSWATSGLRSGSGCFARRPASHPCNARTGTSWAASPTPRGASPSG